MNEVEEYILRYKGNQREVMLFFHELLSQQFKLKPKISYSIPMYQAKRNVAYLNPTKSGYIDFCLMDGQQLKSGRGILQVADRKRVAGIEIASLEEIDEELIVRLLEEAVELDSKKK